MDIEDSKFSLSGSSEYLSQNIETKSFLPREYFTGHRSLFFVDLPALFCGRGRQRSLTVQRSSHVRMRVPKCKLAVRFSIAYRMTAKSVIRRVSAILKPTLTAVISLVLGISALVIILISLSALLSLLKWAGVFVASPEPTDQKWFGFFQGIFVAWKDKRGTGQIRRKSERRRDWNGASRAKAPRVSGAR